MKCNDCGKTEYEPREKVRADICPDCWKLREMLINELPGIPPAEFQALQRTIADSRGSGRGAAAMREVLGLDQPQI